MEKGCRRQQNTTCYKPHAFAIHILTKPCGLRLQTNMGIDSLWPRIWWPVTLIILLPPTTKNPWRHPAAKWALPPYAESNPVSLSRQPGGLYLRARQTHMCAHVFTQNTGDIKDAYNRRANNAIYTSFYLIYHK